MHTCLNCTFIFEQNENKSKNIEIALNRTATNFSHTNIADSDNL